MMVTAELTHHQMMIILVVKKMRSCCVIILLQASRGAFDIWTPTRGGYLGRVEGHH